jgi:hypothetical protein
LSKIYTKLAIVARIIRTNPVSTRHQANTND